MYRQVYEVGAADSDGMVHVGESLELRQCGAISAKGGRLTPPEGGSGPEYTLPRARFPFLGHRDPLLDGGWLSKADGPRRRVGIVERLNRELPEERPPTRGRGSSQRLPVGLRLLWREIRL